MLFPFSGKVELLHVFPVVHPRVLRQEIRIGSDCACFYPMQLLWTGFICAVLFALNRVCLTHFRRNLQVVGTQDLAIAIGSLSKVLAFERIQ